MLTVCTSSTQADLTTTQTVLDVLGASATSGTADFSLMALLVSRASDATRTYLGYEPLLQTYLETVPAYGGLRLMLSRTPIRAVLRFFDSTSSCTASAICSSEFRIADEDAGFLDRDAGWTWSAGQNWALTNYVVPNSELRPWMIEYAAGWIFPQTCSTGYGTTSTGRDLPYDIEMAVIETAKTWFLARQSDSTIRSKTVGDLSISYATESCGSGAALPTLARNLLAPWRRQA